MLKKAKHFATIAHTGQVRKSTGTPMITHPIRVAETLKKAGFGDEVIAAGYLHDVIEDTTYTANDIEREFGNEVLRVVLGNTENKDHSWEARKQHTIDWVKEAPFEIKALIVADKLDNLTSLIEDYERFGDELWMHFKRGKDQQKWYFTSVCQNAFIGLGKDEVPDFFYLYQEKVKDFFN